MATTKNSAQKKSNAANPRTSQSKENTAGKGLDLKKSLNAQQLKAVSNLEGPQLVVAGAGSGKTRVLTYRIANLVKNGIKPSRILAVTFTNKAAGEMAKRVDALVGEYVPISTFHSFCLGILREFKAEIGMERGFVVYDQNDQLMLLKECMRRQNVVEKHLKPQFFANQIGLAKNRLETAEKFARRTRQKGDAQYDDDTVAEIYREYEKELKQGRALDFDDLIMQTVLLFQKRHDILEKVQKRYDHVLVDEFQDTNYAQYQLVKLLVKKHGNLFIVGDPDQSIYRFRGAETANIKEFENDFKGAAKTVLEENYRSTPCILAAANDVIERNTGRDKKKLFTKLPDGDKVEDREYNTDLEEAQEVASAIKRLVKGKEGYRRKDIVIFYRVHMLSRNFETELVKKGIPYKLVGDVGFYSRREIKDQLAYMRAALNPYDDVSLRRIINSPTRGLGETTQETLANYAQTIGSSFYEALQQQDRIHRFTDAVRRKLKKFLALLDDFVEKSQQMKPGDFLAYILEKTDYVANVCASEDEEDQARRDNLSELAAAIAEYEAQSGEAATTEGFLNDVALMADIDKWNGETDCVTLMTIHNAKGLEFPVVFMVGMEEDLFPHSRTGGVQQEVEEERRLCYVGMTRAQKKLVMTHARKRYIFNVLQPRDTSRFLGEILPAHITRATPKKVTLLSESVAPAKIVSKPASTVETGDLTVGMKVQHSHFGVGVISSVMGEGESARLTIEFESLPAPKVLVAKYAKLKPLK